MSVRVVLLLVVFVLLSVVVLINVSPLSGASNEKPYALCWLWSPLTKAPLRENARAFFWRRGDEVHATQGKVSQGLPEWEAVGLHKRSAED